MLFKSISVNEDYFSNGLQILCFYKEAPKGMRKIIHNDQCPPRINRFDSKFHTQIVFLSPDPANVCEKSYTISGARIELADFDFGQD